MHTRFAPSVLFGGLILFGGLMATVALTGCSPHDPSVMMAPPTTPVTISQSGDPSGQGQVYNWTDVPVNQQAPITRAVFDQGGYQLYSPQGTIVVPFANQNMYVMKFGQSATGGLYFINNGSAPTLFLPPGAALDNAAQPGARWYPFPQNYAYNGPVYVGLAPSWSAFTGMGWYPGMSYYGGYWGNSPYSLVGPMIGLHFLIGGSPYYGWNSYHSYYNSHPYGYAPMRVVNRTVYNQASRNSFNSGSGSFGRRSYGSSGTTFGNRSAFGSRSSFGSGSFGRSPSGFGSSSAPRSTGSFGQGPSGFGGSFGAGRSSFPSSTPSAPVSSPRPSFGGGSFGGGGSSSPRPSFGGGSFGGGSFGGFGGGSRSSFGGGSFGGGHSSFGGGRHR